MSHKLICLAEIVGVHGIRGGVKIKVFSADPDALPSYAPLTDESGAREYKFSSYQQHQNVYLAQIEGVGDRTAAEKLRGVKLCVPRERLPQLEEENTYYHADLIGLAVKNEAGEVFGKIVAVANFGAGDLLEIKPKKGASFYVPFTKEVVPSVDPGRKEATVFVPPGLLD